MIENILTKMVVFPSRIQNRISGKVVYANDNTMFAEPKYGKEHERFFSELRVEGWTLCPSGYAVYSRIIPTNRDLLIILHGLKVDGYSTAQGRIDGLSVKIDRSKVVQHVDSFIEVIRYLDEKTLDVLVESVHEIRTVNAALYHASLNLQNQVRNTGPVEVLARNTTTLSELISARISLIDALVSDAEDELLDSKEIVIYKKFDKIYKCFVALGKSKNVKVDFSGVSSSPIKGNDHTDIIPLLLMDNAFKYSLDNKSITLTIEENKGYISCAVKSWGPQIEDSEIERIFDRGFRGRNAVNSGNYGSGIGLYFLKKLIEESNGEIKLQQGTNVHKKNGIPYCEISFIVIFPIWHED